jgi:hypothetical protein
MFILDSLMIAGIRWALETTITAAEAEMNDDSVLREQLLEAEMRRETGEISDDEFEEIEADLLARIREIKQRREGGSGPLAFGGAQPMETTDDSTFQIEASVSGDFYDPADAPHTTIVETEPVHGTLGNLIQTRGESAIEVLDIEPGDAHEPSGPGLPLSAPGSTRADRSARSARSKRSASPKPSNKLTASTRRSARTAPTPRTAAKSRTARPGRTRSRTARSRSRTK